MPYNAYWNVYRATNHKKTMLLSLNKDMDYYKWLVSEFLVPQILEGGSYEPNDPPPPAYGPVNHAYL